MHPLVRDLYKRAVLAGRDYPHPEGMDFVRRTWKKALRDPGNCPACYGGSGEDSRADRPGCEREVRLAVGRGRKMVQEMVGVAQLKKYRAMRRRYGDAGELEADQRRISDAMAQMASRAGSSF